MKLKEKYLDNLVLFVITDYDESSNVNSGAEEEFEQVKMCSEFYCYYSML